jgi:CRISPR-associated protein Cmr6
MSTRRETLADVQKRPTTNAGLWLDKFIIEQAREDKESRSRLVQQVAEIPMPKEYPHWFEQWQRALREYGAECRVAETQGRMVIGLGSESVLETSVTLHRTYGVPYIPGSALKGLAASFTRQHLGEAWQRGNPSPYTILFGDTQTAGYITFFDAMPLPNSARLHPDIITVHHEGYYQKGTEPPADWDDPNPVPFLSATGRYLIALAGPSVWVEATFQILRQALKHLGIGARTSSGYGRLELELAPLPEPDREKADQLIERIEALRPSQVAGSIHAFYEQWRDLEISPEQKRRVAEAIIAKVKEAKWEKQARRKDWYQELVASIQ